MTRNLFVLSMLLFLLAAACDQAPALPKPRGYPKVEYPQKGYRQFDADYCSFTFEYPVYAQIMPDTNDRRDPFYNPCWFDIYFPDFDCRIYCSYYQIGVGKSLDELKNDAFELVDWHNKKANYIDEKRIQRTPELQGMAFSIEGPAATPFQFYLTDNKSHFFRGALYFNTKINPDSLAPLYEFVRADLDKLIGTFEWKK